MALILGYSLKSIVVSTLKLAAVIFTLPWIPILKYIDLVQFRLICDSFVSLSGGVVLLAILFTNDQLYYLILRQLDLTGTNDTIESVIVMGGSTKT